MLLTVYYFFYLFHYSTQCNLRHWKVVLQTTINNRPSWLVCCRWLRNTLNRWVPTTGGSLTYNTLLKTVYLWCCTYIIVQFVCTFTKIHWLRAPVLQENLKNDTNLTQGFLNCLSFKDRLKEGVTFVRSGFCFPASPKP